MLVRLFRLWSIARESGEPALPAMHDAAMQVGYAVETAAACSSLFELAEARLGRGLERECCCSISFSTDERALIGVVRTARSDAIPSGEEGLVGGEGFAVDGSLVRADVNRQHAVDKADGLPDPATSHAVREYLAVLDDAAFGGATPVPPKQLAVADPAARWTAASRERAFFAYATNYLIDLQNAVIVDVEATTAIRQAEVTAQRRMIDRTQERFGLWPERLVGDAGYGDAKNLSWLVEERGIEPHIPVFDKSARRDDTFERSAFTFDHGCPPSAPMAQI